MANVIAYGAVACCAARPYTIWYVVWGLAAFSEPDARAHGVQTAVLKATRSLSDASGFGKLSLLFSR